MAYVNVKCFKDGVTHEWYLINYNSPYIFPFISVINTEYFVKKSSIGGKQYLDYLW